MEVIINNTEKIAIYEQIYTQIKNQIISNTLKEDELLPSIRSLAKALHVSVITTKRAYEELERDGYIYTISGKGSFVAKRNNELIKEEYLRRIEEHIESALELANTINIDTNELIEMIHLIDNNQLWEGK